MGAAYVLRALAQRALEAERRSGVGGSGVGEVGAQARRGIGGRAARRGAEGGTKAAAALGGRRRGAELGEGHRRGAALGEGPARQGAGAVWGRARALYWGQGVGTVWFGGSAYRRRGRHRRDIGGRLRHDAGFGRNVGKARRGRRA